MTNINKHTRVVLKKIPSIDEILRRFSNSDISAPDTNAFSPAPAITATRISLSAWKSVIMSPIAVHISRESAFRRAGLLKTIQPTWPSFRAIILSVRGFILRVADTCIFSTKPFYFFRSRSRCATERLCWHLTRDVIAHRQYPTPFLV